MSGFDLTGPCAHCGTTAPTCEDTDAGCCDACRSTGGCTHDASPTPARDGATGHTAALTDDVTCECGHSIDRHGWSGCWHGWSGSFAGIDVPEQAGVCTCIRKPSDLIEAYVARAREEGRAALAEPNERADMLEARGDRWKADAEAAERRLAEVEAAVETVCNNTMTPVWIRADLRAAVSDPPPPPPQDDGADREGDR